MPRIATDARNARAPAKVRTVCFEEANDFTTPPVLGRLSGQPHEMPNEREVACSPGPPLSRSYPLLPRTAGDEAPRAHTSPGARAGVSRFAPTKVRPYRLVTAPAPPRRLAPLVGDEYQQPRYCCDKDDVLYRVNTKPDRMKSPYPLPPSMAADQAPRAHTPLLRPRALAQARHGPLQGKLGITSRPWQRR